jgi:peptidoglycan/xylan/chitin deacetylase (PgdA/CDA1 family)
MLKNLFYKLMVGKGNIYDKSGVILVLMYHEVMKDSIDIESWTVVKQSEFEKQMVYLLDKYTIISIDEALKLVNSREQLYKNYIVVTFDDGYSCNYDIVYPIIDKYKIPITIYVATRACKENEIYWYDSIISILQVKNECFIDLSRFNNKTYHIKSNKSGERKWSKIQDILEDLKTLKLEDRISAVNAIQSQFGYNANHSNMIRHLTINEIKELSRSSLVTIGAHSHCHNLLPSIPYDIALKSIIESKQLLEVWTSVAVNHFSYPNGDYDENVLSMVKQTGFISGTTTHPDFWKGEYSTFEIPRLGVGRYDSIDKFKYIMSRPKR